MNSLLALPDGSGPQKPQNTQNAEVTTADQARSPHAALARIEKQNASELTHKPPSPHVACAAACPTPRFCGRCLGFCGSPACLHEAAAQRVRQRHSADSAVSAAAIQPCSPATRED